MEVSRLVKGRKYKVQLSSGEVQEHANVRQAKAAVRESAGNKQVIYGAERIGGEGYLVRFDAYVIVPAKPIPFELVASVWI